MAQKTRSVERIWQELKRRKVIRVVSAYAVAAFVILQLADMVGEPLHLPGWTIPFLIVLLSAGFILAVILSWAYDLGPGGVEKTGPAKTKVEQKHLFPPENDPTPKEKSIAVLPFVNMSPEKDQDYFCDGITEEIINTLAHIENFKVIARTSAFAFKDKQADIREIGKILGVETLLEGSIRKDGNQLRITAQLIKVADGSHIWSERYDRYMKDVFAIQDEISAAIAENLKIRLLDKTKAMIARRYTGNPESYNLYLKGTHCYQMLTTEGLKKASEYFEEVLQKDPHFVLAYVGLGYVRWLSTVWGNVAPNIAYPEANDYASKALKIDASLAEAYSVLGNVNTFYSWNWEEAERNFRHALQINPNSSMIHVNYSALLTFTNRHDEAISEAKAAQGLDPLSGYINIRAGEAFAYAGQYDRAIEEYEMALTIHPDYYLAHAQLGNAYRAKGMFKESLIEKEKAVELSNGNAFLIASLACEYYQAGKPDQAENLFKGLKKRSATGYVPATSFFSIHKVRAEEDLALEWLKKACDEHDTFLPWLRGTPIIPDGSVYMALLKERGLG